MVVRTVVPIDPEVSKAVDPMGTRKVRPRMRRPFLIVLVDQFTTPPLAAEYAPVAVPSATAGGTIVVTFCRTPVVSSMIGTSGSIEISVLEGRNCRNEKKNAPSASATSWEELRFSAKVRAWNIE